MALLEVNDIVTAYGSIEALKGITLTVDEGEVVTLIGSNGAGKSTTLRSISGLTHPKSGSILYRDHELSTMPAQEIVRLGISQSPEGRRCFQRMTVRENLELGAYLRKDANVTRDLDRVLELFPRLKERERQKAGTMSGGEQQMLALARGLATDPAVLVLDELSMGLAPLVVEELYGRVGELARTGISVLVVEQFARVVLGVADRAAIMLHGCVVDVGAPHEIESKLSSAYLGG